MKDPFIEWLQQRLVLYGYNPGPVDGIDGPQTRRAISAFASSHGLGSSTSASTLVVAALRIDPVSKLHTITTNGEVHEIIHDVSPRGIVELAGHEGIVLCPYKDDQGNWTFGVGHYSGDPDPKKMIKGVAKPLVYVLEVFKVDLDKYEERVTRAFTRPLTQYQFDAATSFDFNTGAIDSATWVKKFNDGDDVGASRSFLLWDKPASIIGRREAEHKLFFEGEYSNGGKVTIYTADVKGNVNRKSARTADGYAALGL